MENWYRFYKQQTNRDIKIGPYEIIYKSKHQKEESSEPGKTPSSVDKESVKLLKDGQKIRLHKDLKKRLIEALSRENLEEIYGLLPK
ncbi:MAG: hypothetical protein RAK22_01600 [Nanoarchaeota archaeon]|nr:hypothetical protein [Nanoarchaeota archaeon]